MANDILTLALPASTTRPNQNELTLKALDATNVEELAQSYLESYPPEVAASNLNETIEEITATFNHDYGVLRSDASASIWIRNQLVGCIMVVERSIWDEDLSGPFIIELFVSPSARGKGAGRLLLSHAVESCNIHGDTRLSLRFGEGTSPAAMAIYQDFGFHPFEG